MLADVYRPEFLKKLGRLRLHVRAGAGLRPGHTLIPRTSQSSGIEFEAYKEYAPGDDFRHVDWNAVGRLDQVMVRTFTAEREVPVHLFLDASASMGVPAVDRKFDFAKALVASLAYIVLARGNAFRLVVLREAKAGALPFFASDLLRHEGRFARLRPVLEGLRPAGRTMLGAGVRAYAARTHDLGVAIVVSDFHVAAPEYEDAIGYLAARGYEVKAVQVLGAAESHPERLFRRGKLYDVEGGGERWITLTEDNLRCYREALAAHIGAVRDFCHRRLIVHAVASTENGLEGTVARELPQTGLLRRR
jgi:hypothetical protein